MWIERLFEAGNAPLIHQGLRFTEQRHRLLAENIANVSTPGYIQKDLDLPAFQQALQKRLDERADAVPGTVSFDGVEPRPLDTGGILFHDRSNRSMEQLMTETAKNALMHNMLTELLRKQMGALDDVLRERIG